MAKVPFEAPEAQEPRQDTTALRQRKIKSAMAFLQEAMAGEPRPAAEVEAEGLAAGHARSTLAVARERLHIASKRRGNAWIWTPPTRKRQAVTK